MRKIDSTREVRGLGSVLKGGYCAFQLRRSMVVKGTTSMLLALVLEGRFLMFWL